MQNNTIIKNRIMKQTIKGTASLCLLDSFTLAKESFIHVFSIAV